MPEKRTIERAQEDAQEGKSPGTQAGEFVREEMDHIREGKHGARNTKQAIAIGLSKARRAGVKLAPPSSRYGKRVKEKAEQDEEKGEHASRRPSPKRSRATSQALKREGHSAASHKSLSKHARTTARIRRRSS
jgi:Family of unknown function (DUF6496)